MKKTLLIFITLLSCFVAYSQSLLVSSGPANAYVVNYPANFSGGTPPAGIMFTFKASIANTGASTLQLNTYTANTIVKNSNQPLQAGDISANAFVTVIFDGTSWQMLSVSSTPATSGTVTNVSASLPLSVATGSTTPSISIAQANGSTNGYLSSVDWTTFNNKIGSGATASGDLSGTYPSPSVGKIQGVAVSTIPPVSGQSLVYNGAQWLPTSVSASGTAGGDLSGTYPNPSVIKLNGNSVSASAPLSGDVMYFNLGTWKPGTIGGDLTGTFPNPTIVTNAITTAKIANSAVDLTTKVINTLPVANGGTGSATTFTPGSIVFAGASGIYKQNNSNLFWDDVNTRLGIGNATPAAKLDISVFAAGPATGLSVATSYTSANSTAIYASANTGATINVSATAIAGNASGSGGITGTNGYGVSGSSQNNLTNYAIYGQAFGTAGTTNFGVYGQSSGAAGTTSYGVYGSSGVSTGDNYGVYALASGAGTNSYGLYANVTGGTNKYAGVFMGGNVGIGTNTPNLPFTVIGNSSITGIGYFSTISGLALNGASIGSIVTVDGVGKLGFGPPPSGGGGLSGAGQTNGIAYYTGANTLTSNAAALSWNGTVMSISGNRFYLFNSGANSNVVLGNDAGNVAFTGANNNIIGYQAGLSINTGNRNNLFGYQAGNGITSGASNNILGYQAGFSLGTGNYNNILGYQAGYSTAGATAQYNNYLGWNAGYYNVGGASNNFLGYNAGGSYSAGDWNTFIGFQAGFKGGVSTNSGSDNIFIGKNAGSNNTTGTQNIAIGSGADFTVGTLSNAIAIGYTAVASVNNTMILGGTGANAVNVGINTNTPQLRLDARGTNATATTAAKENIVQIGATDALNPLVVRMGVKTDATAANRFGFIEALDATPENLILQPGGGNIGVGITTPAALLHVNGTVKFGTSGTIINGILKFTSVTSSTAGVITAGSTGTVSLVAAGVAAGDIILLTQMSNTLSPTNRIVVEGAVAAANSITVTLRNTEASSTYAAGGTITFNVLCIK